MSGLESGIDSMNEQGSCAGQASIQIRRSVARCSALVIASVLALVASGTLAQAQAQSNDAMQAMINERLAEIPSGKEGVKTIMKELTKELTLTKPQRKEIRPIVRDTVGSMEVTRDRFKAGEITPMALAMQLQMAGKKSAVMIEPMLTEEQLVKYKEMQMAQRRQMMQAMSQSGAGAAPQ
jgi:hypothetical protein